MVVLVDFASWFWWFVVSPPPRPARGARQGPLAGRPSSWVPPKTPGCQGTKRWVPAREPRGAEEAFGTCQGPRSADEAFDAPQEPRGPSTPDAPKRRPGGWSPEALGCGALTKRLAPDQTPGVRPRQLAPVKSSGARGPRSPTRGAWACSRVGGDHASGGKRLLLQITFETKILLSFPWFWLVEPIKRYDAE